MMRFLLIPLLLLAVVLNAQSAAPIANQLRDHASPYLAMHGDDPVRWQEWGAAAFARASGEGKLRFVSSGYFSCHWCHVMQRESYRNPELAAYINAHFIPVKIDRELLPAIDAGLIDFSERTRGQAGWPLNVFLTPAGHPLVGVLYLPPASFEQFLRNLVEQWDTRPERLAAMAAAAAEPQVPLPPTAAQDRATRAELSALLMEQALQRGDDLEGGFGAQNKFPMAPQLRALLEIQAQAPDAALGDFLRLTLDSMAGKGLRDHLAGGFFRYTVDPVWQTPHFEKMLYDNALLARLYLRAAAVFDRPDYAQVARDTLDFVLDAMRAPGGGFHAAFSAVDGAGVEGGYYLWDAAQVEKAAGAQWPLVRRYWGLKGAAGEAAGHHLIPQADTAELATEFGLSRAAVEKILEQMHGRLLLQREQRSLPVDTKVLAGWNGLLLSALADAAETFSGTDNGRRYRESAAGLRRFIVDHFVRDAGLVRARHGPQVLGEASLEDYAYVLEGLQRWQAVSGDDERDAPLIGRLIDQAWERYYVAGRWRLGEDRLLRWGDAEAAVTDGPMPSPPAVLMKVSQAAGVRADATAQALQIALPEVRRNTLWLSSFVTLYP